jgi:hypothetical protein
MQAQTMIIKNVYKLFRWCPSGKSLGSRDLLSLWSQALSPVVAHIIATAGLHGY